MTAGNDSQSGTVNTKNLNSRPTCRAFLSDLHKRLTGYPQSTMKVLLILSTVLALHVAISHASLLEELKDVLKTEVKREEQAEKREQAEMLSELKRALKEEAEKEQAKKREEEENAAVEKLVRALKTGNEKRFWDSISSWVGDKWDDAKETASEVFDNAQDAAGNGLESFKDTVDGDSSEDDEQSQEVEELDIPSDLKPGSNNPCRRPVVLNETGSGKIDFPGNGKDYPRFENCHWIINSTVSGKKVNVTFVNMDINERGCDDYVEVFSMDCNKKDGKFIGVPQTKKLCKENIDKIPKKERTAIVPERCAYIHFRSNMFWNGKGFQLEYSFI